MQEFLDLFQRNWRQLEKQVFLCCFISFFAKPVDVHCIFNNIDYFRPFRSLSGHPRVTLLMLDHSNFECLTLQGLSWGILDFIASQENQRKTGLNFLQLQFIGRILVLACHELLVLVYR